MWLHLSVEEKHGRNKHQTDATAIHHSHCQPISTQISTHTHLTPPQTEEMIVYRQAAHLTLE